MTNKRESARYIRWFETLSNDDVALVGGKNASLGELYQQLVPAGVKVPNGFAITAEAFHHVLAETQDPAAASQSLPSFCRN